MRPDLAGDSRVYEQNWYHCKVRNLINTLALKDTHLPQKHPRVGLFEGFERRMEQGLEMVCHPCFLLFLPPCWL